MTEQERGAFLEANYWQFAATAWTGFLDYGRGVVVVIGRDPLILAYSKAEDMPGHLDSLKRDVAGYNPERDFVFTIENWEHSVCEDASEGWTPPEALAKLQAKGKGILGLPVWKGTKPTEK